jgi:hypothetical protein
MKTYSNAYRELKRNYQNDAEFLVLICHAVPALKAYMKYVEGTPNQKLPDPDHFQKPQPTARLKGLAMRYRKIAGRVMFLASFAYFEAYFIDLLKELIAFHGGIENWLTAAQERTARKKPAPDAAARRLREPAKHGQSQRYEGLIEELSQDVSFRFPSERFCAYGIHKLAQSVKDLKASQIAEVATFALGVSIPPERWQEYEQLRDQRNKIAHGRLTDMDLTEALNASRVLFELARQIDHHTVTTLMLLESPKAEPPKAAIPKAGMAGVEPAPMG